MNRLVDHQTSLHDAPCGDRDVLLHRRSGVCTTTSRDYRKDRTMRASVRDQIFRRQRRGGETEEAVNAPTQLPRDVQQQRVIRQAPKLLMEAKILLEHPIHVAELRRTLHLVHNRTQPGVRLWLPALLDSLDNKTLKQRPQAGRLFETSSGQRSDTRSPSRKPLNQALVFEASKRLSNGDMTDAEVTCDRALNESRARRQTTKIDLPSQVFLHGVCRRTTAVTGLDVGSTTHAQRVLAIASSRHRRVRILGGENRG